jgi:hypothetical protein
VAHRLATPPAGPGGVHRGRLSDGSGPKRSLAIRNEIGYRYGIGMLILLLGFVAAREGDLDRAVTLYRDGLAVVKEVHGPWTWACPWPAAPMSRLCKGNQDGQFDWAAPPWR